MRTRTAQFGLGIIAIVAACQPAPSREERTTAIGKVSSALCPETCVDEQFSASRVSGVMFHGERYLAYPGTDFRVNIIHSPPPAPGALAAWSAPQRIGDARIYETGGVALATFHDKLYFAFNDTNGHLGFRSSSDGSDWSARTVLDATQTPFAPALVVHSDTLVFAYGEYATQALYVGTIGDDLQGGSRRQLDQQTDRAPSVATYDSRLFIGWTGVGNKKLNWEELGLAADHTDEIGKVTLAETSDDGLFIAGNGSHFIASWRGDGSTKIHRAILGIDDVAGLAGTTGQPMPNAGELQTEDSPYTPTVARFGPTTALLWAGTDARVNIKENFDAWTMTCHPARSGWRSGQHLRLF